jgi:hypothetical protein
MKRLPVLSMARQGPKTTLSGVLVINHIVCLQNLSLPISISMECTHSCCNTFLLRKGTGKLKIVKKHSITFVKKQAKSFLMLTQDAKR